MIKSTCCCFFCTTFCFPSEQKGSIIASNKVSSRVLSVSFSQDNSYFVTAGNRHVKFWYLDASKERRVSHLTRAANHSSFHCCL